MVHKPYYWRKRKCWYLRVEKPDGKISQVRIGANEQEAFDNWKEMLREAELVKSKKKDPPLIEILDLWIGWLKQQVDQGRRSQTYYDRILQTTTDFLAHFPDIRVSETTSLAVSQWFETKTWKGRTQKTAASHLRAALNWAVKKDFIEKNPLKSIDITGEELGREQIIDQDAHYKLMKECLKAPYRYDRRFALFLAVMFHTGCRPGELANLKIEDWKGDYWIHDGKTTRATGKKRVVYTVGCAATILKILANGRTSGRLYQARNGAMTRNAIRIRIKKLREDAKLPSDTVAYCYRHGFTHRALVNGVPMHMVAELLGHTSTRMIEQVYGHLDKAKDLLKEAASMVAKKPK